MTRYRFVVALLLLAALMAWASLGDAQAPGYVIVNPPSGYLPPTIIVRALTPGVVQVCAESINGIAGCRSVDEFRQWVTERPFLNQQRK